jgi:glycosyltransferase involved in cell wall biosynthesis
MVFEVRDLWPDVPIALNIIKNPFLKSLAKWLEMFAYKNSQRIVALAPGMAESIIQKGFPAEIISVIPNGADIELFDKHIDSDDNPFPFSNKITLISYIGTIGLANGVDYIPQLAQALKKKYPDTCIRFAIIGDGRFSHEVRKLAESLGVLESMVFFIGSVAKRFIPGWLARSSATIMTYTGPEILYRDSVSNKFFDSLAAGCPVFANFRGFSTQYAESEGAGVILPAEDLSKSAEMLYQYVNNQDWMNKASQVARKLAETQFNREHLACKLETVLLEAVDDFHRKQLGN